MLFPDDLAQPAVSDRPDGLARQWASLHDAARLVAGLAGAGDAAARLAGDCPDSLRSASGWRLALIGQAIADTAAILEGGIRALLIARGRGAAIGPAAQALWDEFLAARGALLALAPRRLDPRP